MYFSCGPLADRFTTNPATSILNRSFSLGRGWLPKQSPHITNIAIVERENFMTRFLSVSRHRLNRESKPLSFVVHSGPACAGEPICCPPSPRLPSPRRYDGTSRRGQQVTG